MEKGEGGRDRHGTRKRACTVTPAARRLHMRIKTCTHQRMRMYISDPLSFPSRLSPPSPVIAALNPTASWRYCEGEVAMAEEAGEREREVAEEVDADDEGEEEDGEAALGEGS